MQAVAKKNRKSREPQGVETTRQYGAFRNRMRESSQFRVDLEWDERRGGKHFCEPVSGLMDRARCDGVGGDEFPPSMAGKSVYY